LIAHRLPATLDGIDGVRLEGSTHDKV